MCTNKHHEPQENGRRSRGKFTHAHATQPVNHIRTTSPAQEAIVHPLPRLDGMYRLNPRRRCGSAAVSAGRTTARLLNVRHWVGGGGLATHKAGHT